MPTKRDISKINAALETGDLAPLKAAILELAKQKNFSEFAASAGVNRENTYRLLKEKKAVRSDILFKLIDAAGLKLQVAPKH